MIVDLYDGLFQLLSSDQTVLNYLQVSDLLLIETFAPDITEDERLKLAKAMKIQRQQMPKQLIESLPIMTFYSIPGGRDSRNISVYNGRIMFDIYTQNNVDLALGVTKRLFELLDKQLLNLENTASLQGIWLDGYESPTNDADTYCFTNLFDLSIVLEN